jgi:hypothetical protein
MRLMLVTIAMLDPRVSQATQMPWCAGTNTGHSFHYNCNSANLRQPRILQSEPVLPRARIRSTKGQAEAISLLIRERSLRRVAALANLRALLRAPITKTAVMRQKEASRYSEKA